MRSRTLINLVTVVIASTVLVLFAVTQLLASAVLDNRYPLYVELDQAGGLHVDKQVTYRGVGIGQVVEVAVCDDPQVVHGPACTDPGNVRIELGIDDDVQVPLDVDLVVLRQSAIGEQAVDIRPREPVGEGTAFHEEGQMIRPASVVLPPSTQSLLEAADRVFAPVDVDDAATVVAEIADAVRGRSDDLRSILADSASFSEAIADNGADYDRLFAASRVVNASLAESRQTLADVLVDLADGAELIGGIRGEVDALLDVAPGVLASTTSVLERGDANLGCVIRDLGELNAYINQPGVTADLEEAIRVNEFFFEAFRVIGPHSAQGDPWLRVHFILEPQPPPVLYEPPRPIPPILPGGACQSVLGLGAGSAVQEGFTPVAPESRVIRPEDDRQTPVRDPRDG